MKWKYKVVRTDHSAFAGELDGLLEQGYEPFFVTIETGGKRYLHLRMFEVSE